MIDNIRKMGKWLVLGFFVFWFGCFVFALLFVSGIVILDESQQRDNQGGGLLIAACILGLFVFFGWLLRDAFRSKKELPKDREAKPRPNGDMSDVAGVPKRDPWLG